MIYARRSLRDSVVVITGASSGIGKAAAIAFAEQGAHVVLAARRPEALEQTAQECRRRGVRALVVPTDTADPGAVDALADRAIEAFGHFDVWVNNAAAIAFGSLAQTPPEAYRRLVDVNFLGYVHGARAAVAHFTARGRGVLINTASLFSLVPTAYTNAYTATKHAVGGLSDALRQELVPHRDVHVVKVLPAGVDTPILEHAANYTGHVVRPLSPLVSADRVARVIVRCARRPRRAALVGGTGRLQVALYRLAPAPSEWLLGRATAAALRRADPRPPTDGALYEPVARGTDAGGGLRARSRAARIALSGGLAAGAVSAAVAAARRARR